MKPWFDNPFGPKYAFKGEFCDCKINSVWDIGTATICKFFGEMGRLESLEVN